MTALLATYRLQLTPELDLAAVGELVPYLRELGVSHLYLSPVLQARSGSTHGYDVVDPTRVSDALGGEDALRALREAGLPIVLDVVPNHMAASDENRWWADPELRVRFFDVDPQDGWYRRFFDIDDLAALRIEDDAVFAVAHAKVLELLGDGVVEGLRIDHPDGLADPAGYLRRLRDAGVGDVWVEKVLDPDEELRDWPVCGTVGYEFLNEATALFVDPEGEAELDALHVAMTGETRSFAEIAVQAQLEQATTTFARELARLQALLDVDGYAEALARLPVYRTYVEPATGTVDPADAAAIAAAGIEGRLADVLLLRERGHDELVTRFQQTSPPVTAKGVEDTAFYRYLRLLALNEVGGDPSRFGLSVADFHVRNVHRHERFPRGLLATQTHDTKRSADARARIGALAGMAGAWRAEALCWRELAAALDPPDGHAQYLLFQTLVGVWPIEPERLDAYLEKALREAKLRTSWVAPDGDYERSVQRFARALLADPAFVERLEPFVARVAEQGRRSSLGQLLLKLTSPGIPDLYQGDELEVRALVDPDNRRPVDWQRRREALARLRSGGEPRGLGEAKLALIWRALALRARRPDAFEGDYRPLTAGDGACAFLRGDDVLVAVGVRDWHEDALSAPAGRWRDVLRGGERELATSTPLREVLDADGLALLERLD